MAEFEVGRSYAWADPGYDPFTVLRRTEKTILVTNKTCVWRMLIRHDESGEYVIDSSVPQLFRSMFTSRAIWLDPTWK